MKNIDLFGNEVMLSEQLKKSDGSWKRNKLALPSHFGPGPAGVRCKACAHFIRKRFSKTYFKCALRGNTNGPGTDHRANWPACGKFKQTTKQETQ